MRRRLEQDLEHDERGRREYARAWLDLLDDCRDVATLAQRLVEDTERMRALRQATPFAGILDSRERWAIWRSFRHGS